MLMPNCSNLVAIFFGVAPWRRGPAAGRYGEGVRGVRRSSSETLVGVRRCFFTSRRGLTDFLGIFVLMSTLWNNVQALKPVELGVCRTSSVLHFRASLLTRATNGRSFFSSFVCGGVVRHPLHRSQAHGGAHLSALSGHESRAHQLVPESDHSA